MKETSEFREELRALAAGCAGLSLRQAARRVTLLYDEALRDSGLSLAQVGLMAQIATSADDRMAALAARAGLDPSTLSRNLRGLERDGLIEIATVEKDLRRRAVWLTEEGSGVFKARCRPGETLRPGSRNSSRPIFWDG
jgi:DNA-binding MarR family transcriptional regulator